jgi:hypothetical protein
MDRWRRWRALILFVGFTALAYGAVRFKRDTLVDFVVYHRAAIRTIDAEPLYRPDDGHYQFKYLPAFAMAMAPFAFLDRETASGLWFAISAALLVVFLRGSVHALPDRRLRIGILLLIASILLAKSFVKSWRTGRPIAGARCPSPGARSPSPGSRSSASPCSTSSAGPATGG